MSYDILCVVFTELDRENSTPHTATYNDAVSHGTKIGSIWVLAKYLCTTSRALTPRMRSATSECVVSKTGVNPIFCPWLIKYGGEVRVLPV